MLWYFLEWSIKRVRAQRNREEIGDYGGKREKKGVISKKKGAEAGNARFWRRNVWMLMSLHPCKISTLTFIDEIYVVNSSFTVKACPLYSPPQGGALVCTPPKGTYQPCAVMCRTGTDYVFSPPLVYFCSLSSAKWDYFSFFHFRATLPWPDCSGKCFK